MDITQTVLLSVIVVLTVFLVLLGCQAFFVLKDVRKTLIKVNKLFDDADNLVGQVKNPITSATNLVSALTAGAGLAHLLKQHKKEDSKK
ncbi:hypothetical protein HY024_04165 [Candidatus Curtissbacteria bacterium]|nr:hypothetical protein [Candidatus Curtissbacteria bacterium]